MRLTATGRIRTLTGTGTIPRLSATARVTQGRAAPRAQLGLVSAAVEVHDPSGILTVAEDLEDGSGVRLGVSGAVAADPSAGAMFALPLIDPAGRPHPAIPTLSQIPPVHGALGLRTLSDWTTRGTPSGAIAYVGLWSGLPTETGHGLVIGSWNDIAGQARVISHTCNNGAWDPMRSGASDAGQSGAVTSVGQGPGTQAQYGLIVQPWDGWTGVGQRTNQFTGETLRWQLGTVPHLVVGVYQPAAGPGGVIEVAPVAELWSLARTAFADRV